MDELDAVRASLDGDRDAFEFLVECYSGPLGALAYDRLGSVTDAQDAVQEAFIEAYRSLSTLQKPEAFGSWLYGILRNVCAMRLRSRSVDRRALGVLAERSAGSDPLTPLDRLEASERRRRLREAVESLSPALREIVVIRYLGGADRAQAASVLGISLGTADKRLERAMRQLREVLGEATG